MLFVFAWVPWTVVKSLENAVPKVFPWFFLLASVSCVYYMVVALVSGKVRLTGFPRMCGDERPNFYIYRSGAAAILYWILVAVIGFFAIVTALVWWFVPRT